MTLPTLKETFSTIRAVLNRFPLPVLIAFCGTVAGIFLVYFEKQAIYGAYGTFPWEYYNNLSNTYFYPVLLTCIFALPLALAVDVFTESRKIKFFGRILGRFLVLAAAIVPYFYFFRFFETWGDKEFIRFFILVAMGLSFLSFAPFLFRGKLNGFWQYVMTLLTRFIEAFFYFAILFFGVALLLASIDYLFEITIDDEYYMYAWIFIVGILSMLFFFAGIPKDFSRLEKVQSYAKDYKVLTEYVLVPLVFAYLIVLYAYSAKILISWEWPMGNVSSWIIAFSVAGVITYFLSYGSNDKALAYVKQFRNWLFLLFIPLIVVLFFAVGLRISDYGITEPRYYIVLFGIWLLLLSFYLVLSSKKDIRVLPISLFIVLLISIYGPLSSFELSKGSQLGRLENLLEENSMIEGGKIVKTSEKIRYQADIVSIVQYLVNTHGVETLQPWFEEDLNYAVASPDKWQEANNILALMGIEDFYGYDVPIESGTGYINYHNDTCPYNVYNGCVVDVSGYDNYYHLEAYPFNDQPIVVQVNGKDFWISLSGNDLIAHYGDQEFANYSLEDLLAGQELNAYAISLPKEKLTLETTKDDLAIKLVINNLGVEYEDKKIKLISHVSGYVLIKK